MGEKQSTVKMTIIMVCYNAGSTIEASLKSLECQTYRDYEVVIVDGQSDDHTVDIINNYRHLFKNCKVISEPDKGIYDAMNKGVVFSKGEYIYFLNAGDCFFSENTLKKVVQNLSEEKDILYGDMICGGSLKRYPEKLSRLFFLSEKMICHQAIFAKKYLLEENPFIERYGLCADRYWLYQCFKKKVRIFHIDELIGYYDTNGKSSNIENFQRDSIKVIKDDFGFLGVLYVRCKRKIGKITKKNMCKNTEKREDENLQGWEKP